MRLSRTEYPYIDSFCVNVFSKKFLIEDTTFPMQAICLHYWSMYLMAFPVKKGFQMFLPVHVENATEEI